MEPMLLRPAGKRLSLGRKQAENRIRQRYRAHADCRNMGMFHASGRAEHHHERLL